MKSKTKTLIEAMQILSNEIHSEDGVANAAIFESSERLDEQQKRIAELENKLIIARSFIPTSDLVKYSMKLDKLKEQGR